MLKGFSEQKYAENMGLGWFERRNPSPENIKINVPKYSI